jgi:Flp pilus assembly protein TadB
MPVPGRDVRDILRKYGNKLQSRISTSKIRKVNYSQEYVKFKDEMAPEISRYERWSKSLGNVIKLNVSEKDALKIKKYLDIAHLDIAPWQPLTLSVMAFLAVFFIGLLISVAVVLINADLASFPFLFFFLTTILSFFTFYFTKAYPERLANKWRLKASSQMVPAILYVVVYMRHTSNLERAIAFASEHLQYPLALDFKKVFYDVQIGKFSSIKESLDNYLETWRDYSTEFIEAFHLIESSLYEPDNSRRIITLEKSLKVVLDGVYDKMLGFTHTVKSPLTNVYMLGVVLPTLGLALLPLATAMLGGLLTWIHIFVLFNLIIPFFVFYLTDKIIFLRPGGYGETSLLERNPLYHRYRSRAPYFTAFFMVLPLLILGFLPFIFQYTPVPEFFGLQKDFTFSELGLGFFGDEKVFGFVDSSAGVKGPFGVGALILSLFIPLGLALFFGIAFKARTRELILERKKTKQLEREFNNSLFQLGNRIGNGVPPELVFGKVAESSKGLRTEELFRRINYNIRQMGMSVEKAIFDPRRGAIMYYPSDLIAISMRILIESSKKGLKIAAISMMSISEYVKNINKITSRLKDMLAEVISDMKSNMSFLAPLLSGVVVGLAAMITAILTRLRISELQGEGITGLGGLDAIVGIFEVTQMVPPYFLQVIVGIYLIQIIFILTRTLVAVDSGEDKLQRTNSTGKNLERGILLFFMTALLTTLALFILVFVVMGNLV